MYQAQAVAQSHPVQLFQSHQQLRGVQSELACIASTLAPLSGAVACQFDTYAQVRSYPKPGGGLSNDAQFGQFLYDQEHPFAHLLCQEGQLNVILVFVSVADNEAVAVHVGGQHGMKFWLRSCFQSQVVTFTMTDDLFHHRAHLVDLDGEDDEMLTLVVIFLLCFSKAFVGLLNAIVQDVGETQQNRSGHMAGSQLVHHFFQVHLYAVLLGSDIYVSFFIDAKIVHSPSLDIVQLLGVFNSPFLHVSFCVFCFLSFRLSV